MITIILSIIYFAMFRIPVIRTYCMSARSKYIDRKDNIDNIDYNTESDNLSIYFEKKESIQKEIDYMASTFKNKKSLGSYKIFGKRLW